MPTSRDVARIAGVSQSTVSYALSGKRAISDETRRKIDEAIAVLGYHVNSGARRLRENRTSVLALLVPEQASMERNSMMSFISSISSAALDRGYDIVLVTADEGAEGIRRVVGTRACDGMIMMELDVDDPRLKAASDAEIPTVVIGYPDRSVKLGCVDLDFYGLARYVLERFAALGHRHVVINADSVVRARKGYMQRFMLGCLEVGEELGLRVTHLAPAGHDTFENIIETSLLGGLEPATAFFSLPRSASFLADLRCLGVLDNRDAAVILFDDELLIPTARCKFELVAPRRAHISNLAVKMLVDAIEIHETPARILVPAR